MSRISWWYSLCCCY